VTLLDKALVLFQVVPSVTTRKMFGGVSIYSEGRIFAVLDDNSIYLKADDAVIPEYEASGGQPFTFIGANGVASMKYYRFPSDEVMLEHLSTALMVAHRAPMPKVRKPRI
jgi:DNA transformation protein and related proteins